MPATHTNSHDYRVAVTNPTEREVLDALADERWDFRSPGVLPARRECLRRKSVQSWTTLSTFKCSISPIAPGNLSMPYATLGGSGNYGNIGKSSSRMLRGKRLNSQADT